MKFDRLRREEAIPLFPLTAMVDVLFLMIIFLVLGASFDQVETVRLPQAQGRAESPPGTVQVELRADGRIWLGGVRLPDGGVIPALRVRKPRTIVLLPDERADVGTLFRWYDDVRQALRVPVAVGVRAPTGKAAQP